MASIRVIIVVVLSTVMAVAFGQIQQGIVNTNQNVPHQNQVRVYSQVILKDEVTVDQGQEITVYHKEEQEIADKNIQNSENPVERNQAPDVGNEANVAADTQELGGAHRDAPEENTQSDVMDYPFWTSCNFGVDTIKSCYDCHKLLICKPFGGLVKVCRNPFRPYCNNGSCSPLPSAGCD